ncbi:class I SAM-dependent methyltransferase [Flavobacterium sp. CGRL1]
MTLKKKIKSLINKLPYVKTLYQQSLNSAHPNGHFYSPIVSIENIKKREFEIWKNVENDGIAGINLRTEEQKSLIRKFVQYYEEIPFKPEKQNKFRYYFENDYYSYTDSIILYSFIRHFKPKRIIEIGSGFSSAIMLDTNEFFFNNEIDLTFIDPYAERLLSLITQEDLKRVKLIESDVQLIPLDVFKELQSGDILFVDSTHVTKTGSDVNYILFEILPTLNSGVLIHFHDIFYPFEYPKEWVYKGYSWNEDYILKAFLMYNDKFEIKSFSEYLHKHHKEVFEKLPLSYLNFGGNLWIEKK